MNLQISPAPEFSIANEKKFISGEEHVTRRYERSVLILMTAGELSFLEDGKKITLHSDEYYIQRHGLLQEGVPLQDPPSYIYIEFHGSYAEEPGLPLRGHFEPDRIMPPALRLCNSYRNNTNPFYLAAYMNRIFGELIPRKATENRTALLIKSYIESDYSSNITLKTLSEKFNYAEDYIARIFKREFDTTPHQHLATIRLVQAMWLLENTELPCEKICNMIGYNDFSAFWRAFKSRYSVSPGDVRRKSENSEAEHCMFYKPLIDKEN